MGLAGGGSAATNSGMNRYFAELGQTVRERWKCANFGLRQFPEIARVALEERPPFQEVAVSDLMEDFLLDDNQPFQSESGFGEPELVVYDDPRFYIQVLFWLDGTTDIHQHQFSGAFHVLAGSSLHSRFEFAQPEAISAHLRMGELRMKEIRLLERGSTETIISGAGHIHALFHLETPSVTVVVRTHSDPGTGPQFTYLPPHLAVDPFRHDSLTARRKQLLDVLEQTGDPAYATLVAKMLGDLDFERGFFILQNGVGHLRNLGQWEECLEIFQRKHGALAAGVAPVLNEIIRRDGLVELRRSITEVEHRYFLALLLNVPSRADLLDLIAQRVPGPPVETILRWLEELAEPTEWGLRVLDMEFPPDLAARPETIFAMLGRLLEGGDLRKVATDARGTPADWPLLREILLQSSLGALAAGGPAGAKQSR